MPDIFRHFDVLPDAVVVVKPDGTIVYFSKQAERLFGYSPYTAVGLPLEMLIPERFREIHAKHRSAFYADPAVRPMGARSQLFGRREDGSEFPVDIMLSPLRSGKDTLLIAVVRDATDRVQRDQFLQDAKQALELRVHERTAELEEANQRLRAEIDLRIKRGHELQFLASIVEDSDDAIIGKNLDAIIQSWNRGAEKIYGYSSSEAIGQPISFIVPPENADEVARIMETIRSGGRIDHHETTRLRKDGTKIPVSISVSPVRNENGSIIGASTTARDLTARKHAEEERERLQKQFLRAQKMEAVGRLAGGIVHDFNNLLTGIMTFCDLLLDRLPENDTMREAAEEARKSCIRSAKLTRQLLAVSRGQPLERSAVDLNEVIDDMSKMLRNLIAEDIEVVTVLDPKLGSVVADPGGLEQVILNLAVNARDAMPGGGKLVIKTANVEADEAFISQHIDLTPGPYVMLCVSDTGTGMDAETMSHLFEPFYTTKGGEKGTGLGLSTVYGMVKQSGGSISVYSEPGQGSTFKVYLPRAETAPRIGEAGVPVHLQGSGAETILVVEDDNTVRITACAVLRSIGYSLIEAKSGDEALRLCGEYGGPIHLVLADVVMPGMSGPDLIQRLRPRYPAAKVLFMSAHVDDTLSYRGVLTDGSPFLQKPFTRFDLIQRVRQILARGHEARH